MESYEGSVLFLLLGPNLVASYAHRTFRWMRGGKVGGLFSGIWFVMLLGEDRRLESQKNSIRDSSQRLGVRLDTFAREMFVKHFSIIFFMF